MTKSKDKPLRFEEAVEQLEGIIEQIESGQAGLEDSLVLYERGMKLIAQCRGILTTAEKKIAELSLDEKGRVSEGATVEGDDESVNDD